MKSSLASVRRASEHEANPSDSKKHPHRFAKWLLAAALLVVGIPVAQVASEKVVTAASIPIGTVIDGLIFDEVSGVVRFKGINTTDQNNWPELLIIPEKVMWGGVLRRVETVAWVPHSNANNTWSNKPTRLKIGKYVSKVDAWGFGNLFQLSEITFPASVSILGSQAFRYGYGSPTHKYLGNRPTTVASDIYQGVNGTKTVSYRTGTTGWPGASPLIGNTNWEPATNSQLSSLSISSGSLQPSFSTSVLSYSVDVGASVSSVVISPVLSDANAAVTVNGISATSGNIATQGGGFSAVNLVSGLNLITVEVTAQDQITTSTYVISITGGASVTYEANGGTGAMATQSASSSMNLTANAFTRAGYTFDGWNTLANGSGVSYANSASYSFTSSMTLYAQWTADSLTVTYDSQEGSTASGGSSSTTTGGTLASLPTTSREGYTFGGWFTAASGGSQITTSSPHGQTADFTLHAQWTISTYAVSFNGNGSTGGSVPGSQTKTHGIDVSVSSNSGSLVKAGYTFADWNTAADGSGTSYAASATYGVDVAVTLYAKWTASSLTVTYDSQEGSSATGGSSLTTTGARLVSLPTTSRVGYTLRGWFTAASGGSQVTTSESHGQIADFTLYAQWTISTYAVSFNGNGSTGGSVPANQTKTHGIDVSVSSNSGSLVKTGYTFGGWNTAANGSGTSYAASATYGVDAGVTLYAKWTASSLTVTYDSQGGSAVSTGSSVSGGSITSAPVVPTRAGYVFTGWFTATSGGTAITFPYTHSQTTSFTLYAQWSQASLYGLGSVSKIATITTTTNISNTFSVDTETSSVSLRYLANGLPADSVIDVYLVNDLSRARSLFAPAGGFVVSLVVAWLAADGSVPLMASGKPLSMTIANDTIKAGAKTYAIVGGEVTLLGTATVDGTVTISITQDPEIVVVNPVAVVSQPSATPATPATPASPATESRRSSRPVVAPVTEVRNVPSRVASLLPKVLGATSKIAAILNTVVGQLPPRPMVFAPKLSSNGTVERVVFKPVVLKAPPIDAPVAPMGAKVIPIGSMIEQSKETPVAPVSKVGAGESKATFGGKTIETALETSLDGAAVLSAGPATIALAGFTSEPASSNGGASTSSGLTASSSTPLEIATGSFIASTPVQVWLFSTPMLLAETSVDENGNFAAAINLPSSLPAGNHTLQIQGFVYTASGAAEVTANIGVSVAAASVGVKWTSTFPLYVASISPSVRALWTTFVSGQASPTLQCTITGIRPQRNSKANIRLFENRQIALTTLLKYNGCVSIETKTQISATKSSVENRTWKVEVQSKATAVAFRWVHDYKTYSSTITAKQKTQWVAKVEKYAGQKLSCAITGAEPLRSSSANTMIFNNRNKNLKTYLLKNGCSTVQINSPISKNIKIATRTKWKVEVSTSN